MNKQEVEKLTKMLDKAVEAYLMFRNRDDYPEKPCVRREASTRQSAAFNLADYLYHYGFISWEKCCEIWCKIGMSDDDESCSFTKCGANIGGKCKYIISREGGQEE